jgi:hypothetical protein
VPLVLGTDSSGRGGNLAVTVSSDIFIKGDPGEEDIQTGLFSVTNETGQGGNLSVTAGGSMIMDGSARVLTRTLGGADAGTLTVNAKNLTLTNGAQIFGGIGNAQADGTVLGFPEGQRQGGWHQCHSSGQPFNFRP